jgi:hypothetical protein
MKIRKFRFITYAVASLLLLGGVLPGAITAEAAEINPDKTKEPQPAELTKGDYAFASDLYWLHNQAYSGGSAIRDGNCAGEYIWSCDLKRFPKGIGIHAASGSYNAYVDINIENIGYTKFATWYGVCETLTGNDISMAAVKFTVIGDGKTLFQSDTMRYGQPMEYTEVDVTGVKTLRLAVAGAPSISGAWCIWGGAVLSKSGDVSEVEFYKELTFDVTAPETEAPTEPETTPDTETPTEPETAVTYPETHQAETIPVTEDSTEDDTLQEVDPPEKGCGSALVGVSTLAVTAAAALTLRKRKED